MSDRERYPKSEYQKAVEYNRARNKIAAQHQEEAHGAVSEAALRSQGTDLAAQGVMPGALPRITARMSPADRANAQAAFNGFHGMSPTEARAPRNIARPALPKPVGSEGPVDTSKMVQKVTLRGSTPAEISSAAQGGPTGTALTAQNTANNAIAAAAGTGKQVQTPFGAVSSTVHPKGTPENDVVQHDTGVKRLTPFEQVVKNHPQVGIAGTPENLAYVKAYRTAQAAPDGEKDPVKLGLNLFNPKPARDLTAPGGEFAPTPAAYTKDIKGPPAIGAPLVPTPFAGSDTGPMEWKTPKPAPSAAARAGAEARQTVNSVVPMAGNYVKDLLNRNIQADKDKIAPAIDYVRNLFTPGADPAFSKEPTFKPSPVPMPEAPAKFPEVEPLPPMPGTPSSSSSLRLDMPTGGPLDTSLMNAGAPKPLASNNPPFTSFAPDADTAAFAENPADAEFRKALREPKQTAYTA